MRFRCQTFSSMFAKPRVMVLLIHHLISLKATIVAMIPSTKKCGGKPWETIGLITEMFAFTRKGLMRLLPAKTYLFVSHVNMMKS